MDIIESIERYVAGTDLTPGTRTRLIRARDEIVRLRKALEQPAQQEPKFVRNVDGVPSITLAEHKHLMRSRPQAREWVGLTDAQIGAVAADIWGSVLIAPQSYQAFARAIEAKLKEKQ